MACAQVQRCSLKLSKSVHAAAGMPDLPTGANGVEETLAAKRAEVASGAV